MLKNALADLDSDLAYVVGEYADAHEVRSALEKRRKANDAALREDRIDPERHAATEQEIQELSRGERDSRAYLYQRLCCAPYWVDLLLRPGVDVGLAQRWSEYSPVFHRELVERFQHLIKAAAYWEGEEVKSSGGPTDAYLPQPLPFGALREVLGTERPESDPVRFSFFGVLPGASPHDRVRAGTLASFDQLDADALNRAVRLIRGLRGGQPFIMQLWLAMGRRTALEREFQGERAREARTPVVLDPLDDVEDRQPWKVVQPSDAVKSAFSETSGWLRGPVEELQRKPFRDSYRDIIRKNPDLAEPLRTIAHAVVDTAVRCAAVDEQLRNGLPPTRSYRQVWEGATHETSSKTVLTRFMAEVDDSASLAAMGSLAVFEGARDGDEEPPSALFDVQQERDWRSTPLVDPGAGTLGRAKERLFGARRRSVAPEPPAVGARGAEDDEGLEDVYTQWLASGATRDITGPGARGAAEGADPQRDRSVPRARDAGAHDEVSEDPERPQGRTSSRAQRPWRRPDNGSLGSR